MHIIFTAHDVSYNEALGGDIAQALFNEVSDDDLFKPSKYYFHISVNYEFPPFKPTVEWFDGSLADGGANILNYKINKGSLQLWLDNGLSFDIKFDIQEELFSLLVNFVDKVLK